MMDNFIAALASLLSGWAVYLTPTAERDWARGMCVELTMIDAPGDRLRWAAGALGAAIRLRLATGEGRFDLFCLALLVSLTSFDWKSPDSTPTILMIATVPALLAFAQPKRAWGIGLLFGVGLFGAHWLADFSAALRPFYQRLPLSPMELIEIAAAAGIAFPAAWLGAKLRLAI